MKNQEVHESVPMEENTTGEVLFKKKGGVNQL